MDKKNNTGIENTGYGNSGYGNSGDPAEVVPMLEKVLDVMREPAINFLRKEREDEGNFHERS